MLQQAIGKAGPGWRRRAGLSRVVPATSYLDLLVSWCWFVLRSRFHSVRVLYVNVLVSYRVSCWRSKGSRFPSGDPRSSGGVSHVVTRRATRHGGIVLGYLASVRTPGDSRCRCAPPGDSPYFNKSAIILDDPATTPPIHGVHQSMAIHQHIPNANPRALNTMILYDDHPSGT